MTGPLPPDYPSDLEDLFEETDPEDLPYLEDALDEIIDDLQGNEEEV